MRTAVADPMVGRVLEGRYRLEERLARGGTSVVYAARDLRLDRAVAVKVMPAELSADAAFTDRFAREARAAARLSHLNVVGVYDHGHDPGPAGGHVFLVMELVDGSTVRDLVVDRGALGVALTVAVMEPMLAALAAAHRAGLVHRDVKPENVLLSDDGLVKVADFGLARAIEADVSSTRTNLMMGTVAYCSPEHVTRGYADARSDVYSAGVVLFELLTGRVPYVGQSALQVAWQHVHSRVPAPSSRVRGIPEELDDLVIRATDPDPAARPADAGAFLAELHDLRAALRIPVTALPTGLRRSRRAGAATTGAAVGAAGASAATAVTVGPAGHTVGARPVAAAPATAPTHVVRGTGPVTGPVSPWPVDPADVTTTMGAVGRGTTALPDDRWTGGWGPGTPPTARPTRDGSSDPVALPAPVGTVERAGPDWKARRRRRRRRLAVVVVLLLLLGAGVAYGSWWYADGRWAAVPDVAGRSSAAATDALRSAGFAVKGTPHETFSETVGVGDVVATDPPAGERRTSGTAVVLTVSRGKERFDVPKTAGMPVADAQRELSTIPVEVVVVRANSDTAPKDTAIGTDPAEGSAVKRDSRVTLTVSDGPPQVAVPDVRNQPNDAATATLQAAAFEVDRGDPVFSDSVPEGSVVSQDPAGGTATKFSTVTLVLSKGPDLVTVPSITNGTPLESARATLEQAGLKVSVKKTFGGYLGLVVAVDPKGGEQVRRGTTVTVTVV